MRIAGSTGRGAAPALCAGKWIISRPATVFLGCSVAWIVMGFISTWVDGSSIPGAPAAGTPSKAAAVPIRTSTQHAWLPVSGGDQIYRTQQWEVRTSQMVNFDILFAAQQLLQGLRGPRLPPDQHIA